MDKQQKAAPPMRYQDARPLIQTGDLIAVRETGTWLGRLIRRVTGRPYTHVAVAKWESGRLFMAGLNSGYNHLSAVSHLEDFDVFQPPIGLQRDVLDMAIDHWLEKRITYGYAAFLAVGIECLTKWSRLFDNWRSVVVCSGGSVMIYEKAANLQAAMGRPSPTAWLWHTRQLSPGELAGELLFKLAVRKAAT